MTTVTRANGDIHLRAFEADDFDVSEFNGELSELAWQAARLAEQLHQMRPAGAIRLAIVAIRSQASELSVRFEGDGSPRPMQWHLPVSDWAEQAKASPSNWAQSLWRPGPGQREAPILWERNHTGRIDPHELRRALERDLRRHATRAARDGCLSLAQELNAGGSERAWTADRRTPWMQAASTDLAVSRVWQSVLLISAFLISAAMVQNGIPLSLGSALLLTLICTGAWTQVTPSIPASAQPLTARLTPAASSLTCLLLIAAGQPSGRAGLLALGLSVLLSAAWSERWRRASDRTEALASVRWQWNGPRFIDLTPLIASAAQLPGHPRHRARMAAFGLIHHTRTLICTEGSGFKISAFPAPPQSWPRTTVARIAGTRITGTRITAARITGARTTGARTTGARTTGARTTGARTTGAQLRRQTTRSGALVEAASPLDTPSDAA